MENKLYSWCIANETGGPSGRDLVVVATIEAAACLCPEQQDAGPKLAEVLAAWRLQISQTNWHGQRSSYFDKQTLNRYNTSNFHS